MHSFGCRTAQRFTQGLSNCRMFSNYFGWSRLRNGSKRMNFAHNWIGWGNGCKFLVSDRDMWRINMPIVLSLHTCISLYTLCARCRTSTYHILGFHRIVIISLHSWIRMKLGTGCVIWRLASVMQWLDVSASSEFVMLLFLSVDDAMRNAYLRFFNSSGTS